MTVQKGKKFDHYNEVYGGESSDCPISSPVCICQDSPNKGCEIASALPRSNISGRHNISFMQLFGEVAHKICRNSIIS